MVDYDLPSAIPYPTVNLATADSGICLICIGKIAFLGWCIKGAGGGSGIMVVSILHNLSYIL